MKQKSLFCILMAFAHLFCANGFGGFNKPSTSFVSKSSLSVGPLQKFTNKQEYNKVVDGLMFTQGITREEAEKEYDAYLDNPNNYALQKVC